jgi:hypothetical protein
MAKRNYYVPHPARRRLKIFAFDPMLGRTARNRITVDIPNDEQLAPGPRDSRIAVIDYDPMKKVYYPPVDLDRHALTDGIDPTEADPRFHQQMVYAVARRVLENFDIALGRRFRFRRNRTLRIFPHALPLANAFYDPKLTALLFGYFRSSPDTIEVGLPNQTVFTCLSHDIVAHEMTHALVDRLRPLFIEPTNVDVAAFHEGYSDIIAILQHFSFPGILRDVIQETQSDLHVATPLVQLAVEFGHATGTGTSLRSAVDAPDPLLYRTEFEAHSRGAILVAAVFGAFFSIYQTRIKDLTRIATGGTGNLPKGDLHPDLVNRIAGEATKTAQTLLRMCIRAFDYLPPIDVTFGDFLRALITADYELNPIDEYGQRAAIIENFRQRGVFPHDVRSLSEDAVLLDGQGLELPIDPDLARRLFADITGYSRTASWREKGSYSEVAEGERERETEEELYSSIHDFATKNARALGLSRKMSAGPISVRGVQHTMRIGLDGQPLQELVVQFVQTRPTGEDLGGIRLRAGVTVIADSTGKIRHVIRKPLPASDISSEINKTGKHRLERLRRFVTDCDARDTMLPWTDETYRKNRIAMRMSFAALHASRPL